MADSKGRAGRLRAGAFGVLVVGFAIAFVMGATFPAQVVTAPPTLKAVTTYTSSVDSGDGSFNWLFALLAFGPAFIASAVLLAAAEIVSALRRSGRSRSSEPSVNKDGTISA